MQQCYPADSSPHVLQQWDLAAYSDEDHGHVQGAPVLPWQHKGHGSSAAGAFTDQA